MTLSTINIVQPYTRTSIAWTPDLIRAAEIYANGGSIRLAADLVDDMLGDDRIQLVLKRRVGGLLGKPLSFDVGVGRKKRAAIKALEAEEDWWSILPEDKYSQLKSYALMLNIAPGTLTWSMSKTGRMLPDLEVWHPRYLRFDTTARKWFATTTTGEVEVNAGDGKWVMHCPFGRQRPWTWGLWRGIARWWMLKQFAINDWGVASDEIRVKTVTVDAAAESTPEDRRKLAREIVEMGRAGVIVLPPGYKYEIIEQKADTWKIYQEQINMANEAIAIAFLGNNLSTEVHGGSLAAAQEAGDVEIGVLRYDAESDSTWSHDQILTHWGELNYGSADAAPWPCYEIAPPEDDSKKADTLLKKSQALSTLVNAPPEVDRRALLEDAGIPLLAVAAVPVAPVEPVPAAPVDTPAPEPAPEAAPKADAATAAQSQIYAYDLQYQVVTINERRKELGLPPVPGGDVPPKPPGQTGAPASPPPVPSTGLSVALASGVDPATRAPFVEGQLAADELVDAGVAGDPMRDELDRVFSAVSDATSYEALRRDLPKLLHGLSGAKLAEAIYRVTVMGRLVGREAVRQEGK